MRFCIALSVLCVATSASAAAPSGVPEELQGLNLACDGSASWTQTVTDDHGTIGKFDDDTETKHARNASGRVHLRFTAEGATFRFPPTFAGVRGAAAYNFSSVQVAGDTIIGRAKGLLRETQVARIDRQSGEITLEFAGTTFNGVCQKVEDTPGLRKF